MQNKREQIDQLRERVEQLPPEAASEISDLQKQIADLEKRLQGEMTAWDHVQLSRHENRPYTLDSMEIVVTAMIPLLLVGWPF
jgi:acetyl-CoA carboxylase carboxyl transferase subunit alpha